MAHWTRWLGVGTVLLVAALATAQSDQQIPVYIEDSPAAQELVEQARALRRQGRLTDAVARLQQVVQTYRTKLMPLGDGLYMEASRWVAREVRGDEELLRMYRQVYGPQAERDLAAALRPQPSASALEAVVTTHPLTPAGLDAGLSLAAMYLERADTTGAVSVLDDLVAHPDLDPAAAGSDERITRYHRLAATAALLDGHEPRLADHLAELEAAGGAEAAEAVEALAHRLHPPARRKQQGRAADDLPLDALHQPLWQMSFERHDASRQSPYAGGDTSLRLPVIPVADDVRLYFNEGARIASVDRFSGRLLWEFRSEPQRSGIVLPAMARAGRIHHDRRGVLLMGDRLFAIAGQTTVWTGRTDDASAGGLVCLEAETGEMIWRIQPSDLDPALDRAYFMGTPLAAYDRIFALVRRHQASGFQDAMVVAVDASTGELLWQRHVSSIVTASRYASTPAPAMTLHGGTLYVADNLAVAAAISARSGSLRWERILGDGADLPARGLGAGRGDPQKVVMPPVLVEAGLVVPPSHVTDQPLALDPRTGHRLGTVDVAGVESQWDSGIGAFLLPAGEDILVVGESVALLDGRTLETLWRMPRDGAAADRPASRTHARTGARPALGQAAVTDRHAVVPLADRLIVLSLADGSIVDETPLEGGGNVLALDGQWVVADDQGVSSFMPWQRAYQAMLTQVEQAPTDPGPGLAMTHLALSRGLQEPALQGADFAVAAVEAMMRDPARRTEPGRADRAQQQVFEQVLAFTEPDSGADLALREALFDRLAGLTAGPEQEVAYHLSVGRLYEDLRQWEDAVEHYQAVLLDETLTSQLYHHQDVLRQAGLEAQRRLSVLVRAQGQSVYRRYDLLAARELHEIRAHGSHPAQLIDLAARYPLADAAPVALLEAGTAMADAGRTREAVTQFRRAYVRTEDAAVLAAVAGRLAQAYQSEGRPRQAMQWLRRVSREYPDLVPVRQGQPAPIAAWLEELAAAPMAGGSGAAPGLTLPLGRPYLLRGELLRPTRQPADETAEGRLLTREGGVLRMYGGAPGPLEPVWEAALPAADTELLTLGTEQVLLWSSEAEELISLDTTTGERTWPSIRPRDLFEPLGTADDRRAARTPEQRAFMEMIDVNAPIVVRGGQVVIERPALERGILMEVGDGVICLADRMGGVVGVDRHSGRTLWQKTVAIEQVSIVKVGSESVALGGINGAGTDAMSGAVQVLDLLTGEPHLPVLEDKDPPQWIGFVGHAGGSGGTPAQGTSSAPLDMDLGAADAGLLITATSDQATAHRLDDGEVVWRLSVSGPPLTGEGWSTDELLLLAANADGLLVIEPATGELRSRLHLRSSTLGGGTINEPVLVDGQWQLLTSSRAVAMGPRGQVQWRDALDTRNDPERLIQQFVSQRYVALMASTHDPRAGEIRDARRMLEQRMPGLAPNLVQLDDVLARQEEASEWAQTYRLFLLERTTGRLVDEYQLADMPADLDPRRILMIDNHLVIGAGDGTLVIPGALAEPEESSGAS